MRALLIGVVGLIVLVVAAVLIVPSFIDWNSYKPEIRTAVRDATGRELTIDGDLSLAILPSPKLSVASVKFSNIEGGSAPDMVTLEALDVSVALGPLLGGEVVVQSVTLRKPTILLEKLADGQANWEIAPPAGSGEGSSDNKDSGSSAGGDAGGFTLGGARIEDGTILYKDAMSGALHEVKDLTLDVTADSLKGPFTLAGGLAYQGLPISLEGAVSEIDAGNATSLNLTIGVADKAATLVVKGPVDMDGPSAKLQIEASSENAKAAADKVLAALTGAGDMPAALAQPMKLAAKIDGSASAVEVSDLSLSLGETRLQGTASVKLEPTIDAALSLTGSQLDLDALLPKPVEGGASQSQNTTATPNAGGADGGGFALPKDVSAKVDVKVDAVRFKGGTIRSTVLEASLKDGVLKLPTVKASLPGGTEISVSGDVTASENAPKFAGSFKTSTDNLRGTLEWLEVDLTGVAQDRLRQATVAATIAATPTSVTVSDWTMELDATKARGGLTLALREKPAFGLSLVVDQINVDAYLPASSEGASAGAATTKSGDGDQKAPALDLSALGSVDANVKLLVEKATALGLGIRKAELDATLQEGTLTIRRAHVEDLAGVRGGVVGTLKNATSKPTVDMSFDLAAVSVERLAKALSADVPVSPAKLGKVAVKGKASGDMNDVTLDLKLAAAGGSFSIAGSAQPLQSPPRLALDYTLAHKNMNALLDVLAPGSTKDLGKLGALNGGGRISSRDDGRYANNLNVSVGEMKLGLVGHMDPFAATPDVNMAVEVTHPNIFRMIRIAARDYKPANDNLGALNFKTHFAGPVDQIALSKLAVEAGPAKLSGDGMIDLKGEKPSVDLKLAAGRLELDPWLPKGSAKPAGATPAVPARAKGSRWSKERMDLSGLSAANATLAATFEAIVYGSYVIDKAVLNSELKNGALTVSKFGGGMFGGTFDLTSLLADGPVPSAEVKINVKDADVRQAASAAAGEELVTGVMNYTTELATKGASEFDMVSNLAGNGSVRIMDGTVDGFDLRRFSDRLKELDGAGDFLSLAQDAMDGGKTKFTSLKASYKVENGVLRSGDIALDADGGAGQGTAVVDLPPYQMDANFNFRLTDHPNAPPFGARQVGPIDNPKTILDINELQAFVLQRVVKRGLLRQFDTGDGSKQNILERLVPGVSGGGDNSAAPSGQESGTAAPAPSSGDSGSSSPLPKVDLSKPQDAVKGLLNNILKQ